MMPLLLAGGATAAAIGYYFWSHNDEHMIVGEWKSTDKVNIVTFKINKDKTLTMSPATADMAGDVKWYIKDGKLHTVSNGLDFTTNYKLTKNSLILTPDNQNGQSINLVRVT